jgi:hypothetical protein
MGTPPTTEAALRIRGNRVRRFGLTLLLGGAMFLTMPGAWALELELVLDRAAVTPPSRVGFREERHNPMLQDPMVLTGYLEYLSAGVLHKVIQTPFEETLLVDPDHITIERDGEIRRLAVNRSRSLKMILGAIEAILSGDSEKLEAIFHYELSGTDTTWSVRLTPISRRIARQLTSLQVTGDDQALSSIRIDLAGGEWQLIHILPGDSEQ